MEGISTYKTVPLFISAELGQIFAMYYSPLDNPNSQCIVHIPAFAEEMNKSRHMVAMQAQAYAEQGISVLVLDLWGTGDSQGDFSEATWDIWLSNINTAVKWVQEKQYKIIHLWGVRTGVLLALNYLQKYDPYIDKLICWQPVLNGEQFVMQFLRLNVAAAMMDKDKPQKTTSSLKQQLLNGQCVEVAGYCLNPELALPIISAKMDQIKINQVKQIQIFELAVASEEGEGYATSQWIKHLKQQDIKASLDIISGCHFWATQEISESLELVTLSSHRVS